MPQRAAEQNVAATVQAAVAATASGIRPFPTLGRIGSLEELWVLYAEGSARRGQAALKLLERSGTAWRRGTGRKGNRNWSAHWSEIMLLVNLIRERALAWGLGEGGERAAARRMDAGERVEGGRALSLDAFMKKLKAARKAAGGAVDGAMGGE